MTKITMQDKLSGMKLPTAKSIPEDDLQKYSLLLYGREKIGKTTFCAQFPNALFLSCEPGTKALEVYSVEINNWLELKQVVKLLEEDKSKFKTIIVDTVDLAYKYCEAWGCQVLSVKHLSDEEWGKGWGLVRDEFHTTMSKILKLGRGVVFVSHAIEKEIKRKDSSRHRVSPTMAGAAERILEPMVDIWGYYFYGENGNRTIQIVGDDGIAAGHRIENHFIGVNEIDCGKNAKEAYEAYVKAFYTQVVKEKSPEQLVVPVSAPIVVAKKPVFKVK